MLKSQAFINEDKCEFLPNSETTIKTISSMLAISHKESKSKIKVALSDKFNFAVCENCLDQTHKYCQRYSIKASNSSTSLCNGCKKLKINERKRKERSSSNCINELTTSKKAKHSCLDCHLLRNKLASKTKMIRALERKNMRFKAKIDSLKHEVLKTKGKDKSITKILSKVSKALLQNSSKVREQLTKLLLTNGKVTESNELINEKTKWLIEQIEHMNKQIEGKKNTVRYSPELMRLCTALYAKAPGAYKQFHRQCEFVFPSVNTLKHYRSQRGTKEGFNLPVISAQRKKVGMGRLEGRLLVDECELRLGLVMNEKTREVYGIVDDESYDIQQALDTIFKKVDENRVCEEESEQKGSSFTAVKKVNQFRWVPLTGKGYSFNCGFYFNDGKLTSSSMHNCLMNIISGLEHFDFGVRMLCMDPDGPNKGLYNILSKKETESGSVMVSNVSFMNPYNHVSVVFIIFVQIME